MYYSDSELLVLDIVSELDIPEIVSRYKNSYESVIFESGMRLGAFIAKQWKDRVFSDFYEDKVRILNSNEVPITSMIIQELSRKIILYIETHM